MQLVDIICISLGIACGAIWPLLPDPMAAKRPLGAILWFSLAFGLLTLFLSIATTSPKFAWTLVFTLVGAGAGLLSIRSMRTTESEEAVTPATVKSPQHSTSHA